jgi:catechol 2,3-dioxygenase-like lactoylglutathione lyase family enzyme
MAIHRLNHAVLYVRDVARSVAFYRDVLGFEVKHELPGGPSFGGGAFLQAPDSTNDHDIERSTSQYGIDNAALNAALARTDPATALNPFTTSPNNSAALANLANQLFIAPGDTHFQGWELKVDGPLFTLPGGELRAAFGYEGQRLTSKSGLITGTWVTPIEAMTPSTVRAFEWMGTSISHTWIPVLRRRRICRRRYCVWNQPAITPLRRALARAEFVTITTRTPRPAAFVRAVVRVDVGIRLLTCHSTWLRDSSKQRW